MGFAKAKVAVARKLAVMERGNEYPSGYLGVDGPKDYGREPGRRGQIAALRGAISNQGGVSRR